MDKIENTPLWSPSEEDIKKSNVTKFISYLSSRGLNLRNYEDLFVGLKRILKTSMKLFGILAKLFPKLEVTKL